MTDGLYLSDMLDTSNFSYDKMNVIVAPCGSGKTTAAINKLAPLASCPRKALFLIDTHNGNVRLANEEALTMPYVPLQQTADYIDLKDHLDNSHYSGTQTSIRFPSPYRIN